LAEENAQGEWTLPDGWAWVTTGEIAQQVNLGFPSGKHNTESRGVPHLRPMNISPVGEIDLSLVRYVEVSGYDALREGDVLFNNTNSPAWLGKTTHIRKDTNWPYSNHMTRVRLYPGPNPAWVAYCLHYLFVTGYFMMHCGHHVNQASINTSFLSQKVSIPFPLHMNNTASSPRSSGGCRSSPRWSRRSRRRWRTLEGCGRRCSSGPSRAAWCPRTRTTNPRRRYWRASAPSARRRRRAAGESRTRGRCGCRQFEERSRYP
jgi:hypothetical protein